MNPEINEISNLNNDNPILDIVNTLQAKLNDSNLKNSNEIQNNNQLSVQPTISDKGKSSSSTDDLDSTSLPNDNTQNNINQPIHSQVTEPLIQKSDEQK